MDNNMLYWVDFVYLRAFWIKILDEGRIMDSTWSNLIKIFPEISKTSDYCASTEKEEFVGQRKIVMGVAVGRIVDVRLVCFFTYFNWYIDAILLGYLEEMYRCCL